MKVKHDNLFLSRFARCIAVYLLAFVVNQSAFAEVSTLPPNVNGSMQQVIKSAPHNSTITFNGNAIPSSGNIRGHGSYTINMNNGTPTVQFNGAKNNGNGTFTGTKTHDATFTDNHGQKAQGKVKTGTTISGGSIAKAAGALYGANLAGDVVARANAAGIGEQIGRGNYGEAARVAAQSFADGVYGGAFSALRDILDEYQRAKAEKAADDLAAAQQKKDAIAAQQNSQNQAKMNYINIMFSGYIYEEGTTKIIEKIQPSVIGVAEYPSFAIYDNSRCCISYTRTGETISLDYINNGTRIEFANYYLKPFSGGNLTASSITKKQYEDYINQQLEELKQPSNFFLNESEFAKAVLDALNKNTSSINQNTNSLKDLLNHLWQNGQLSSENTQTSVEGTAAENTHYTSPYTPEGSNTAQQTGFKVNQDGTVTPETIPLPDLPPNSPQAPTVPAPTSPTSPTSPTTPTTGQPTSGQPTIPKDKDKDDIDVDIEINKKGDKGDIDVDVEVKVDVDADICDDDDKDKVVCLPSGKDDKDDIKLHNEDIDIEFSKKDYFSASGVCPRPVNIQWLGGNYEMSWQPFCDMADGISAVIELLGMLTALGFAYGAVKRL